MSSEIDDWSVLTPPETDSKEFSIRPNLSTEKGLQRGSDSSEPSSVLCELGFQLDQPLQPPCDLVSKSCHENSHKGLLSSENVGLLGLGSCPPRLFKADWNDHKDEVRAPVCPSKNGGQRQNSLREFRAVMREGQKEFQDKQKKNSSEQRSKNVESIMPHELFIDDEIIDSLAAEHSVSTAIDSKRPPSCSESATQFPAIGQKPVYGISCTEGSELIAHGVSNEHSTKVPVSGSCHENSLLSSGIVGKFGPGSSQPMVEENIAPLLHKRQKPYQPPPSSKADWNDHKDDVWVSPGVGLEHKMRTKGTTILFYLVENNFISVVDSREHFEEGGIKYVYSDLRKKYRVFWSSVFVVFMGSVPLGQAVLHHLDEAFPPASQPTTLEEVAKAVFKFYPDFNGSCDVYIGGLLSDGSPSLQVVRFDYKDRAEPNLKQELNLAKRTKFAVGAGARVANACLLSLGDPESVKEMKVVAESSMVSACMVSEDTGGYLSLVHIEMDVQRKKKCKTTHKKVINCMGEHLNSWIGKPYLIVLHDRRKQNQKYFSGWTSSKKLRVPVGLLSPVAKVKKQELVISCMEFKDKACAKKMFDFGKSNTELLGDVGLREFEHEKMKFYLATPSKILLESLYSKKQVERLAEYNQIPVVKLAGGVPVAADDIDFMKDSDDDMFGIF